MHYVIEDEYEELNERIGEDEGVATYKYTIDSDILENVELESFDDMSREQVVEKYGRKEVEAVEEKTHELLQLMHANQEL